MISTILLVILIIILLLVITGLYFYAVNQKERADEGQRWVTEYEDRIIRFQYIVEKTYREMKELDNRQIFEKDDEVGIAFSNLLNLINELNEMVKNEETKTS